LEVRSHLEAARVALQNRDASEYLTELVAADRLLPSQPRIVAGLARALALNDRPADSQRMLDRLVAMRVNVDLRGDEAFRRLAGDAASVALARIEAVRDERVGTAEVAFTIDDRHFNPEGVAYDSASEAFFVSSMRRRTIVRIASDGTVTPFVAPGQDDLWMVTGIDVDPERRLLWAASGAGEHMIGYRPSDRDRTGLFAFDLVSGRLVRRVLFETSKAHFADDLEVAPDGSVFTSDAFNGAIYRVPPGSDDLEAYLPDRTFSGPNGLAISPDGRTLFVADYAGAIAAVDVATRTVRRIGHPENVVVAGIDGLEYAEGALFGVQNGIEPNRIVRFNLEPGDRQITRADVLAMNDPSFAEPTLAVAAKGALYVVANSQGARFRNAGPDAEKDATFKAPTIIRLSLSPPSQASAEQARDNARTVIITSDGRALRYSEEGRGDAVVFIHAGWVDARMWAPQVREFARDHRVITYDLCGFGASPAGTQPCRDITDLSALLDALGIDRAALVGTSLGGMVALDFAIRNPARVSALVLANPAVSGRVFSQESLARWNHVEELLSKGHAAAALAARLEDRWLAPSLKNATAAPTLREMVRDNLRAAATRLILNPPAAGRLAEVTMPTLLLLGDGDHPDMHEMIAFLAHGIAKAQRATVPGGHFANLENPEAFNRALRQFLQRNGVSRVEGPGEWSRASGNLEWACGPY